MKKLLAITIAAMVAGSAGAAIIAAWDLQGDNSPATTDADTVAANLSGTPQLSRTGLGQVSANNSFNSNNWNLTGTFDATNKYISFTVTPASGYQLQLTDLQYAMNGSNTAPRNGRWGYTTDGGANWTYQADWTILNPAPSSLATWDFADFTTSNSVEFRFWAYGATSINGGASAVTGTTRVANIAGDDLILNGSVIPEPATVGLVFMGLLGARILRRRMG